MWHTDPFAVLGLPRRYGLDAATIERAYLDRVAKAHPDAVAGAMNDGEDESDMDRPASELNDARRVLSNPEQRAIALWRLLGGVEDKQLSPAFLMEMMATREAMESSKDPAERGRWEAWTSERRAEYAARVGELFARIEARAAAPEILRDIRQQLNQWRYIERMAEHIA